VGAYLAAAGGGRVVGGVGIVAGLVMSPAAANAAAVMPLVESAKLGIRTGDRGVQVYFGVVVGMICPLVYNM
jgi:hypothetical protein